MLLLFMIYYRYTKEGVKSLEHYQIFEFSDNGKIILHHSLDVESANTIANAYGRKKIIPYKTYGFEPMYQNQYHDISFSNEIAKELIANQTPNEEFLETFLKREEEIQQRLKTLIFEGTFNQTFSNNEELFQFIKSHS